MPELSIEIVDSTGTVRGNALAWLHTRSRAALTHLRATGSVGARIVSDPEMCLAHERFTGDSGTTDVLTFDQTIVCGKNSAGQPWGKASDNLTTNRDLSGKRLDSIRHLDVDLILCVDEASRQAVRRGYPVERELLLYLLHGVLHCLGHDDRDEADAARMHRLEDEVLEAIGVGATYAPPGGPEGSG